MQGEEQESDTVGNFCTKVSTPHKHTDNMELRTREQHTHNGEAGTGYRHRLSHSNMEILVELAYTSMAGARMG